jgi:hypothetical protein
LNIMTAEDRIRSDRTGLPKRSSNCRWKVLTIGATSIPGAKAQLGRNETDAAIKAYQKVIEIVSNDAEARLGYSVALMRRKSAIPPHSQSARQARVSLMLSSPMDLRKSA